MSKKDGDSTEWEEERPRDAGAEDLSDTELEDLEREAASGEDAAGGEEEEGYEESADEDDGPADIDEARIRIRELESLRQRDARAKRSMRRELQRVRAQRRMQRLTEDATQASGDVKTVELPENVVFDLDAEGRPSLTKEKWQKYVEAATKQEQPRGRVDQAARARELQDEARAAYEEIKEDYIESSEDPDLAETTIDRLEGAYGWLSRQLRSELRSGEPAPQSREELLRLLEDAGIADDFEDRYGLSAQEVIDASSSERRFQRLVDREMESDGRRIERGGRRRRRVREREDDEERRPRRRRPEGREREVGLRSGSRRSMRRRGGGGERPEGTPTLSHFADMDMEDFLRLPRAEFEKIERMAGRPVRRRRR